MASKANQKSYKLRAQMRAEAEAGKTYDEALAGLLMWAVEVNEIPKTLVKKYCDQNQWDKAMREGNITQAEDSKED